MISGMQNQSFGSVHVKTKLPNGRYTASKRINEDSAYRKFFPSLEMPTEREVGTIAKEDSLLSKDPTKTGFYYVKTSANSPERIKVVPTIDEPDKVYLFIDDSKNPLFQRMKKIIEFAQQKIS